MKKGYRIAEDEKMTLSNMLNLHFSDFSGHDDGIVFSPHFQLVFPKSIPDRRTMARKVFCKIVLFSPLDMMPVAFFIFVPESSQFQKRKINP